MLGVEGVRDGGFSGSPRDIPGDAEGWVFVCFEILALRSVSIRKLDA